jgi:hypothetical protein
VSQVVEEFIATKTADGLSQVYLDVRSTVILFARGWKAGSGTGNGPEPVFPWPQPIETNNHESLTSQNHRPDPAWRTGEPRALDAV